MKYFVGIKDKHIVRWGFTTMDKLPQYDTEKIREVSEGMYNFIVAIQGDIDNAKMFTANLKRFLNV